MEGLFTKAFKIGDIFGSTPFFGREFLGKDSLYAAEWRHLALSRLVWLFEVLYCHVWLECAWPCGDYREDREYMVYGKNREQAGAELCQAQHSLS